VKINKQDISSVANYTHEKSLLNTLGWKRINRIALNKNRLNMMAIEANVPPHHEKDQSTTLVTSFLAMSNMHLNLMQGMEIPSGRMP
jgi:hypothetical protein